MKKWLALLLALILALGTLSSGAIAAAPEDTKIDWPEVHVYSQITQGVGMYYQQAVAGDTMYLNFELMSTGAENERYYVGVAYKGQEQTPLKTWEGKYPEQKYSELSLAWDTTGLEPGEYIVRYYTIVTESDGSELHVNAGPQAMPLQLVADPIPLQSVGIGDGDQLFTQLYLDVANGDEEKMEFLYIIPEPRNTTEPIKYQVTCDNPSVLKAVCNAGYLRLEGLKPGTANVSVNWAGKTTTTKVTVGSGFTDVPEGPWYYEAVQYVAENGLMAGTGNGKFSPDAPLDRAMMVTILYRYEGKPEVSGSSSFTDVPTGKWYSDAIAWAQEESIVAGITETTFAPFQPVTREQMAAIFYRYAAKSGIDTSERASLDSFADSDRVSNYAKDAISWCVARGILSGSNGKLNPKDSATRAEFASILMRYITKVAEEK